MLVFSNFSNLIQAPYFLKIAVPSKLLISSKSTFHFDSQFHLMLCNQSHFVLCKQQIHHKVGNMYVAPHIPLLQTMDHKASGKHCQHLSLELPHSVPICLELCCTSHSFLLSNIWHFAGDKIHHTPWLLSSLVCFSPLLEILYSNSIKWQTLPCIVSSSKLWHPFLLCIISYSSILWLHNVLQSTKLLFPSKFRWYTKLQIMDQ